MGMREKERLASDIRLTLKRDCPAFRTEPIAGGAVWHHCFCLADASPRSHCICVWRRTCTCEHGTWPAVHKLVARFQKKHDKKAQKYAEKVNQAQVEIHSQGPEDDR